MYGIRNFGLLYILAFLAIALAPVLLLFGFMISKLPLKNGQWVNHKIRAFYIWPATVGFLKGSFLPLMMCAAINTKHVKFGSFGEVVNFIFMSQGICLTTVVPLYVMREYWRWWRAQTDDSSTSESESESSVSESEEVSQAPGPEDELIPVPRVEAISSISGPEEV